MLLAVDTSTKQIGLALYDSSRVTAEILWYSRQYHTVELAPAVTDLLDRSGLGMDAITSLGIALGPGSFTSLRVGLAFVKGLALARNLPVLGVPTLNIVAAAQAVREFPLVAILQAGRGRLAVSWYEAKNDSWQSNELDYVTTADELANKITNPTIVCGELTEDDRQRLMRKRGKVLLASPAACVRRPAVLAELAWIRWQAGEQDDANSLAPLYLQVATSIPS
ncbi:MAG: tRNA (adenosine(37)-N6)-threonylcarbamoyltransferase complex dimerization subunit type 1 TsaB [Anaerolineae bacterium]|nr:tRNA (adenosine(37)-N6)-threonylcarbamoyltransferase complex dimerization subunit type 1 TsaB [Anaerolineae bacterium]MDK1081280.1 tRNA (adenosine(37)-N6)-threonylcarbamoyltransferase complex dimerization subunit type 1 TsaB [Anaerolineae bacterium]MDK1117643.1 tRNA (adenosine(37)-N6)-threonylcarbamoyltransferase complex dimerization subunit type 1 TsaB [Anaerolineae bacterium]